MFVTLQFIAWSSLAVLIYVYIGYPLLLFCLQPLTLGREIKKNSSARPLVTLIISCFNEEVVIEDKLKNSLAIDYPKDRLEIIVVSDASFDRTDEIVKSFSGNGVKLVRQNERLGKTLGLNLGVAAAHGEIIVFSDANAMYETDSIVRLVENFADKRVGYVVGEARYKEPRKTASGKSEEIYWSYEIALKTMESRLHSVVGGDGAIYAIRRELYDDLLVTDINDFVNPLQIIVKGYRGIYAPKAICWEETSGTFNKEFDRKVRIVNRAFSGLFRVRSVLNPLCSGFFALEIISHKLLRWLSPFFLSCFVITCLVLGTQNVFPFQYLFGLVVLFFWLTYGGYVLSQSEKSWPLFHYPYYFMLVNVASTIGVIRSLGGRVQSVWNPTRIKDQIQGDLKWNGMFFHGLAGISFLVAFFWSAEFACILSLLILVYIYFGYPLILAILSKISFFPVRRDDNFTPDVVMLICAYNEEDVIEEKIQNCLDLNYPPEKITFVIASDGSVDQTSEIVKKYVGNKLVFYDYQKRQGKIGVILTTMPKLRADIIIFSDANTMCAPDAVRKLMRNFVDPSVGGVSADVVLTSDNATYGSSESLYYSYERWIQKTESNIGSIIGADGGMYAIRRNLFVAPSSNIILDDFVISMNVVLQGHRLVYDSEVIAREKNINTCYMEFLRKSRVVAGAIQAVKQGEGIPGAGNGLQLFCFISHKLLRWHTPIFLILLLGLSGYLYVVTANIVFGFLLMSQIFFYLLALFGGVISRKVKTPIFDIPFYFCMVNGAALYGLYKGYFNKQPTKWRVFRRLAK